MNYSKNVVILKQTVNGYSINDKPLTAIFRLEQESGVYTLFLTTINAKYNMIGEYLLFLLDSDKVLHQFSLGSSPTAFNLTLDFCPNVANGFSVGLVYESDNLPVVVAFAKTQEFGYSLQEFKSMVLSKAIKTRKSTVKECAEIPQVTPTQDFVQNTYRYDDEAVATQNYYELEKEIQDKLKILESNDERLQPKDGDCHHGSTDKTQQEQETLVGCQIQDRISDSQKYSQDFPYYQVAKTEIEGLFDKFPIDLSLTKLFPESTFVRIHYSLNKYYVVGVVKEKGNPKYICYGVPSPYSEKAPKELDGFCSFIPLSIFDTKGDGYFMMFQDAITGECIKKN